MGKILNKIFNIVLVITIAALAIGLILKASRIIDIFIVETGSMEDKIHTGDYVLVHRAKDYSVGDIITYRVNNYFVTHRIVEIDGDKITTKGDANNTIDDEINRNQIEGKVIYCGGLLNFIINFKYALAAFLIGIYLLFSYLGDSKKELPNKN